VTDTNKKYNRVLSIAGSDSGGGAGIQADIKTISANHCFAMTVITALTAQNTVGVTAIHPVPVDFVEKQLEAVLSDIGADAIKIGMLFSPALIEMIAEQLVTFSAQNIVLDPVMVAQSGDRLIEDAAVSALREKLIPLAHLITPNIPEAAVLLEREIKTSSDLEDAAVDLLQLGCANVLIKGGHLSGENSDDLLFLGIEKKVVFLPGKRIKTKNNHGTGCTLSSAIAAGLAQGFEVASAVRLAKEYITGAIASGAAYTLGKGHGPVDHFFKARVR
jgi:hydroxymethylpyrimidine/phosphomethylpyrimidine kinase